MSHHAQPATPEHRAQQQPHKHSLSTHLGLSVGGRQRHKDLGLHQHAGVDIGAGQQGQELDVLAGHHLQAGGRGGRELGLVSGGCR